MRWANDTEYGLVAYVYTRDLGRAFRVMEGLEYGMVGLNQGMVSNPAAPFGGVKHSGFGREGGYEGIEEYLETKYCARLVLSLSRASAGRLRFCRVHRGVGARQQVQRIVVVRLARRVADARSHRKPLEAVLERMGQSLETLARRLGAKRDELVSSESRRQVDWHADGRRSRLAASRRTRSPSLWPRVSLSCLKPSRSSITSPSGRP